MAYCVDTGEKSCILTPTVSNQRDFFTGTLTAKMQMSTTLCHFSMVLASALVIGLPVLKCMLSWLCYFDSSTLMLTQMVQLYISNDYILPWDQILLCNSKCPLLITTDRGDHGSGVVQVPMQTSGRGTVNHINQKSRCALTRWAAIMNQPTEYRSTFSTCNSGLALITSFTCVTVEWLWGKFGDSRGRGH